MDFNLTNTPKAAAPPATALVRDSSDRAFKADVMDASQQVPILVDFWAPWCGPCRQLTPTLEKIIKEKAGTLRLVKINIDENPSIAGQLGIQSIPAVFAFAGGRPVDAFMGALPESEVRRFAEKVIANAPASPAGSAEADIKAALAAAAEALKTGDLAAAAQLFGMVLQQSPGHPEATLGIAKTYLKAGEAPQARAALEFLPPEARKGEDYVALTSALKLLAEAETLAPSQELRARLEKNPGDHQACFDLALALNAEGKRLEAAESLVGLMKRARTWNDDGARKKLLDLFEAWGAKDEATIRGRRLLSALLFS